MYEHAEHDPRFALDEDGWDALRDSFDDEANLGEDLAISCNVSKADHLHARRAGAKGSTIGRVAVMVHNGAGANVVVYIAPSQARRFAAHVLNAADDLDGKTPLAFLPRFPEEAEVEEVEEVVEPTQGPNLSTLLVSLAAAPVAIGWALVRRARQ